MWAEHRIAEFKLAIHILTTGIFKKPYDIPVTLLLKVTEGQISKGRTEYITTYLTVKSHFNLVASVLLGVVICHLESVEDILVNE